MDKSKKGCIDEEIKELLDVINVKYQTTSSCAGRIVVYTVSDDRKKQKTEWLLASHKKVEFDDVKKLDLPNDIVWFRFEPLILHVACESVESACELIKKASSCGFKHSGIMSTEKRIMAEIRGTDFIDAPIAKGEMFVNDEGLRLLIEEANNKLDKNLYRINRFLELLK